MPRVVCAGHANWDVTIRVDDLPEPDGEAAICSQRQAGGGSASNVAVALVGLRVGTALLGSVGRDAHGWLVERELADAGVTSLIVEASGETSVKYVVVADDGEVMVFGNDGANEAYEAADLPQGTLDGAEHLHLTGQSPDTAAALAVRANDDGLSVSFDPGRRLEERDYAEALSRVDTLFLNRREAEAAAEAGVIPDDADLVVKRGADGAELRTAGQTIGHPGFRVDTLDTTGAGDAFDAGYIAARLDGAVDQRALAVANACGALAARTAGARCRLGWEDVDALLDIGPAE